jgi:acyl-CoA reductase-like NAD-dependent aldehyde dehydrogenase
VPEYQQYIGGAWAGSGRLYDDLDPYRGTVVARVAAGTRSDAARAVDAAAAAFPGPANGRGQPSPRREPGGPTAPG